MFAIRDIMRVAVVGSCIVLLLSACGGGGGGGGSASLNYTGNSSPAAVSTGNADALASNLFGVGDSGKLLATSNDTAAQKTIQAATAQQDFSAAALSGLMPRFANPVEAYLQASMQRGYSAQAQIDQTIACTSGSYRIYGTVSDTNYTGTVSADFSNCSEQGVTLSGTMRVRIDTIDLNTLVLTDATYTMLSIVLDDGTNVYTLDGSIRSQVNQINNTVTLTQNLVTTESLTGAEIYLQNLVTVLTYDDLQFPTTVSATFTGRIYDSVHGYTDVNTTITLVYNSVNDLYPTSGYLTMTGSNSALACDVQSSVTVDILVDADGDGIYESSSPTAWSSL